MCPRIDAMASRISWRCGVMRKPCCFSASRSSCAVGNSLSRDEGSTLTGCQRWQLQPLAPTHRREPRQRCRAASVVRWDRTMTVGQIRTVAVAAGRVNLIGEHTDYNGGFVLPTVIPQQTRVALARRSDRERTVTVQTSVFASVGNYILGQERRRGNWLDYVQGVTWALGQLGVE